MFPYFRVWWVTISADVSRLYCGSFEGSTRLRPASANEVLARILDRVGERAARALADAFGLEYDEAAIRAVGNGPNGSQASAKAIEWRPPRPNPKREL